MTRDELVEKYCDQTTRLIDGLHVRIDGDSVVLEMKEEDKGLLSSFRLSRVAFCELVKYVLVFLKDLEKVSADEKENAQG